MLSEVCNVKGKSLILYSVHDVSANRVTEAKCCVLTEHFFLKHFCTLHVVIEYFSLKHGRTLHTAVGLGLKDLLSLPVKPTSHPPLANLTRTNHPGPKLRDGFC